MGRRRHASTAAGRLPPRRRRLVLSLPARRRAHAARGGDDLDRAGFAVTFSAGSRPGIVVVAATGCTQDGAACVDGAGVPHEATARVEVALGLMPALRSAPVAALTVRGDVAIGGAALAVRNEDVGSGGTAVDAGGRIVASALRVGAAAGSPLDGSLVSGDAPLAALSLDQVFARWFGMSQAAWAGQPAVLHLACRSDCSAAIGTAVAAGYRLVAVAGDAVLQGDLDLGTAERPVAIVVAGTVRLRGNVHLTGLLYAGAVDWQAATAGASIRGAVLSAGDYTGDGAGEIVHDAAVLERLRSGAGSFVRVNGSWKDF